MSTIHVITVTFFTFFTFSFENSKKRDFLRFFALLHTFSRTMPATVRTDDICYGVIH